MSDEYIKAIKALANGTGNVLDVMKAINKPYTDEKTGVSANTLGGYNFTKVRILLTVVKTQTLQRLLISNTYLKSKQLN